MKRITAALTALAVIIGLGTSCQKEMENRQEISGSGTGLKVTATIADNGTKVSYQENSTTPNPGLKPSWQEDDIIIGFDGNDETKTYGYEITEINDNGVATLAIITEGDNKGTATADPADGTKMYMFYAPGTTPDKISGKSLTVSLTTQAKDVVPALMMAEATVTNGSLSLQFSNKTAIIGVKAPVMADKNKAYTSLALSGSTGLNTEIKFDLDGDKNLKASYQTPGTLTKELNFTSNSETGKGPDVIYIVACPAEQQNLSFKFNGTEEYFNVENVAIEANNYYRLEAPGTEKQKFTLTAGTTTNGSITFKNGSETITSGSSVAWGTEVTVTATPATGYIVDAITVKGADDSDVPVADGKFTMPQKNVTVSGSFKKVPLFTVASGTKVSFAPGNLYAKKGSDGTWTWGFYGEQYKFHSESMKKISPSGGSRNAKDTDNEIDLFTWGYDNTSTNTSYSLNPVNTTGISGHTTSGEKFSDSEDWGSISGLPSAPGDGWRTLTSAEWTHLLNNRTTNCSFGSTTITYARYLKCKVKDDTRDVYGLMIFPDTFTWPTGTNAPTAPDKSYINDNDLAWTSVPSYTAVQFEALEGAGVVFLPAAGSRDGAGVSDVGSYGYYWSSTANGSSRAYNLYFSSGNVNPASGLIRPRGRSVRLVSVVQ